MSEPQIPDDIHADYVNEGVQAALKAFGETPDYEHLAGLLNARREGYLVADVTGAPGKKKGHRVRTRRSTKGQLVLPIFSSMDEVRADSPPERRGEVRGAVMPGQAALALIASDRFVAAEFDTASAGLVLLRKYVSRAAGTDEITAEVLEGMR